MPHFHTSSQDSGREGSDSVVQRVGREEGRKEGRKEGKEEGREGGRKRGREGKEGEVRRN